MLIPHVCLLFSIEAEINISKLPKSLSSTIVYNVEQPFGVLSGWAFKRATIHDLNTVLSGPIECNLLNGITLRTMLPDELPLSFFSSGRAFRIYKMTKWFD
jgi:hypothetical protein